MYMGCFIRHHSYKEWFDHAIHYRLKYISLQCLLVSRALLLILCMYKALCIVLALNFEHGILFRFRINTVTSG